MGHLMSKSQYELLCKPALLMASWHQMNQAQFWQAFAATAAKACAELCLVQLVPAFHLMIGKLAVS